MPIPITKKKWRDTRPVSCKASGVGEACDDYIKFCLPATNLGTEEAVAKSRDTVLKLQMALRDALTKIKPKDKEKLATEGRIEDWLKQIKTYQVSLATIVKNKADTKRAEAEEKKKEEDKKKAVYDETLRGYGERKDALLKHFEEASAKFDRVMEEAQRITLQADQLAKVANAQPEKADQAIAAIQGLLEKITPYQGKLDAANAEALKKFDPHRSGTGPESATTLGIEPKDATPYSTVFTKADNLRKKMIEQAKSVKANEDSIAGSLEEAKLAKLSPEEKLPAFIKLATDLQVKVRTLTDRISTKRLAPKGILDTGKEYKDSFATFVETVTGSTPDKKPEMRKMAESRATQRYEQVKEIEAGLKSTLTSAAQLMKRGSEGIPKEIRDNPVVKAQIDGGIAALQEAKAYYDRFVKARTDAEQPYLDALTTIRNG